MTEAGVVDDVDYFVASHIGTGIPMNHVLGSNNGFLATSKLDITFKGAHPMRVVILKKEKTLC